MGETDPDELALMACTSMAIFSDTFVLFLLLLTFRRHNGLYFWALFGTSMAQILVCVSTYLNTWVLGTRLPGLTLVLSNVGNTSYVIFEFLVLYSRLHLLGASRRHMRLILSIILAEWFLVEIPLMILCFYSTLNPASVLAFEVYSKWWEVESVLYLVVDISLSSMYFFLILQTWGQGNWRRVHWNIIGMMVLLLGIDATYIVFAFTDANRVILGVALLTFSLKVPIEIYALNMLTEMSTSQMRAAQQQFGALDFAEESYSSQGTKMTTMAPSITTTSTSEPRKDTKTNFSDGYPD